MLSLLWSSLADTCKKNTKLTLDLHGICHTVLVFTVESGQLTTNEHGGRPTIRPWNLPSRYYCTAHNQVNQLQTEARLPSLVVWWEWRLINLTLLLLHSVPLKKRCCIHLLKHIYLWPVDPPHEASWWWRQTKSLNIVSFINHDTNIIPKLIFSITHWF